MGFFKQMKDAVNNAGPMTMPSMGDAAAVNAQGQEYPAGSRRSAAPATPSSRP